jgi:quinol monooxygenase YgiN
LVGDPEDVNGQAKRRDMSEPIVSIDSSDIREGRVEDLKAAMTRLVEFVRENEPRPIAYDVYIDQGGTTVTVFQVHPDSASMEFHMKVAAPEFAKFTELLNLKTMDVYGSPSEDLVEQLQRKSQLLGSTTLVLHQFLSGFNRFESTEAAV